MKIDLVQLPALLNENHLRARAVIVFDVLRATTTMAASLAAGAEEIRIFDSVPAARSAASEYAGPKLLCGEENCLPPPGFDLGNSPDDFTADRVSEKTIFLSTTNGTRAIAAATGAARLFAASFVNARATSIAIARLGLDVTLLCAGTNGEPAPEDIAGAELLCNILQGSPVPSPALCIDSEPEPSLLSMLRNTPGGQNIIAAGLECDIDFAARVNSLNVVIEITGPPLVARKW